MIFTYVLSGNERDSSIDARSRIVAQFGASRAHRIAINRRDGSGMAHSSNCYN